MNGLSTATQNNWAQNSNAPSNNTALHNPDFGTLDRLNNGFAPANPDVTRDQWLDNARDSTNPALKAFYNELVTLAGGRNDNAALNQVLDRYQALQNASTASEINAAKRGMVDQITTMLGRFGFTPSLANTENFFRDFSLLAKRRQRHLYAVLWLMPI